MEILEELSQTDTASKERIASRADAMLTRAKAWSACNTGSWNVDGLNRQAPILADSFSQLDAEVSLERGKPFPIVRNDGTTEEFETGSIIHVRSRPDADVQIICSGHYDTVFPPNTFEEIKPVDNERLGGPGLADMKGGLSVLLEALATFEAGPFKETLGYHIVITPDEEIGNFASAHALEAAARSGAMIGMTYEPAMESGAMSGGRKGSAVFDIVLHGKAAHAGRSKDEGRSAIEAAAEAIVSLEALNGKREGVTVNVGKIDGGSAVNIVPDHAVVRFGARAPDQEAANWTTQEVEKIVSTAAARAGISAHLHGGFYRPPKPRNAAQQKLFTAVSRTAKAIDLDLEFVDTGGVCEGNNIFAVGVPNVDTLGVVGGRIHSNEEYVVLNSFVERATLSVLILNRLADGRINAKKIKDMMGQG